MTKRREKLLQGFVIPIPPDILCMKWLSDSEIMRVMQLRAIKKHVKN